MYKDVKPRVDSRWKKADGLVQKPRLTATTSMPIAVQTKPITTTSVVPAKPALMSKLLLILFRLFRELTKLFRSSELTTRPELLQSSSELKRSANIKKETIEPRKDSGKKDAQELIIHSPGKYLRRGKNPVIIHPLYPNIHSTNLLHQIENIDENDIGNPQMVCEYVNDIYQYLLTLEIYMPIEVDFLANQVDVTPKMRSVLLDWINEVHNQFSLEIETYHMTVSMIDRYLSKVKTTPRRFLQLVGVTCLFMASKYEELMPPEISDFVYVTGELVRKIDLKKPLQHSSFHR